MKTKKGNYFECVVKYDKMAENGSMKTVTETYCVEAGNFGAAEIQISTEIAKYVQGEFEVKNITPAPYAEVFIGDDAETYFKAKLQFLTIDEVTGKEKKTTSTYLIYAKDFPAALRTVQEVMAGTMMDYTTAQICESKVLDLYEDVY